MFAYFGNGRYTVPVKKDCKRVFCMEWIYGSPQASFFIAGENGVHYYKLEEEKRFFKESKHLSGKYHCYLYEPVN